MATHSLQGPLDNLPRYLTDALRLHEALSDRIAARTAERHAAGKRGNGGPGAVGKSLNRAVVVAAVGALEAFSEDLVLTARQVIPDAGTAKSWFPVQGSSGMVQTPNSSNLAKMLWVYFRYDPRPDWNFVVTAAWSELGPGTHWRGTTKTYSGTAAAEALDAMVKVRHGFAHQDKSNAPKPKPGIVQTTSTGKLSLQSHHASNAMSLVAQVAIQTAHGLAPLIPGHHRRLRWKKHMWPLYDLLVGTPAAADIQANWTSHPF